MLFVYCLLFVLFVLAAYGILAGIAVLVVNRICRKMEDSVKEEYKWYTKVVILVIFIFVAFVAFLTCPSCGKDVVTTVIPSMKPNVVSEVSYNVTNVEILSQSGLFVLTVEDSQGGKVEMKYMLPEYEKNEYDGFLSPVANSVDDITLSGDSDKLIVQKMSDGDEVVILSGFPGSNIGNAIKTYELYWKLT